MSVLDSIMHKFMIHGYIFADQAFAEICAIALDPIKRDRFAWGYRVKLKHLSAVAAWR